MIYFTADLHLGHKNILAYCKRPWATIEEHDEAILQNWRDTVSDDDLVYVLGDVTLGSIKKYAERLRDLPGEKRLIAGNHDAVLDHLTAGIIGVLHAAGFSHAAMYDEIENANFIGWDCNESVVLSHFPSEGESNPERADRFAAMRPIDDGRIILCGHVHDQWRRKGMNINVGVDVRDYRPVSATTLWLDVQAARLERRKTNGIVKARSV